MKKLILLAGLCVAFGAEAKQSSQSVEAIKQKIIQQSIENYPGNCPCPYNTASNGSRCGKRSAYNRAGGYAPLCYPEDVSDRMVKEYKGRS
ncbi:MAG: hypothetical protein ACD_6C00001G0005 [uncultured bacterium]|jgi:hypothetical protein|uniref:Uncharacterized protein n=2 Tax=Acinetobacter lwoffii TaxID=28090 RepID=A0AAJ4TST8_ACILW|nr:MULTISPECIES: hypothetical protein [Acinetobacter]EKE24900.1 MAG: hypothetical protein ACD_6C00001G0005 [uncultured bacterium]ODN54251.1 hypothetical protein A9Z54_05070 [Acinetobacter sp. 51m]RDC52394.1 hypothetical protein DVA85_08720 [Acinetobacter sp. RIT592]EEY90110.1 hypothetical protein HMPREF0017_01036 [Acinetobacter lwoffii SH145]ENW30478.1 hypothetical protein F923_01722 [Acinetobacter lwoffii NIPH 478]